MSILTEDEKPDVKRAADLQKALGAFGRACGFGDSLEARISAAVDLEHQIEAYADAREAAVMAKLAQQEPVAVSREVIAFLQGAGPLDGVWFGDKHPTERGAFWWRKHLVAAPVPAVQPRSNGMPVSSDERYLRRLLAYRVNMPHTYFDDGEAQGQEHGISIDFMRDSVADIDAKLRALNVARAAVPAVPAGPEDMAVYDAIAANYKPAAPAVGQVPVKCITEAMHVAACKVLLRAHGLDGLPQRMLDAMLAAAPEAPKGGV